MVQYRQAHEVENMIEACTSKLVSEPQHKKALLIRCSALMKKGEIQQALRDCESVIG